MFAATERVIVAAGFVWSFGLNLGQLLPAAVFIDGNKDKVGAGNVQMRASLRIFYPDFHTDLQASY